MERACLWAGVMERWVSPGLDRTGCSLGNRGFYRAIGRVLWRGCFCLVEQRLETGVG